MPYPSNSTTGNLICTSGVQGDLTCLEVCSVVVFIMALIWFGITCVCDIVRMDNIVEEEDEIAMKPLIGRVNDATYV